jgi:hypothetical protein
LRQEQALEDEAEKIAPNSAVTPASAIQNKKRKGEELDATASPSKKPKNDATAALAAQAAPGSGAGVIGVLSGSLLVVFNVDLHILAQAFNLGWILQCKTGNAVYAKSFSYEP